MLALMGLDKVKYPNLFTNIFDYWLIVTQDDASEAVTDADVKNVLASMWLYNNSYTIASEVNIRDS